MLFYEGMAVSLVPVCVCLCVCVYVCVCVFVCALFSQWCHVCRWLTRLKRRETVVFPRCMRSGLLHSERGGATVEHSSCKELYYERVTCEREVECSREVGVDLFSIHSQCETSHPVSTCRRQKRTKAKRKTQTDASICT